MSDLTPPRPGNDAPATAAHHGSGASRAVYAAAAGTSVNPFDRSRYARDTNRGFGDAMGRGIELALTLVVMVGIGWLVDRWAGTAPLFVIVFSVLGFVGIGTKLYLGYDLEMRSQEEGASWARAEGEGQAPNQAPVPTDFSGAASSVADQLAADARTARDEAEGTTP